MYTIINYYTLGFFNRVIYLPIAQFSCCSEIVSFFIFNKCLVHYKCINLAYSPNFIACLGFMTFVHDLNMSEHYGNDS